MKNLSKRIATIAASLALVVVLGIALTACGSGKTYEELDKDQYLKNINAVEGFSAAFEREEDLSYDAKMFGVDAIAWAIYGGSENEKDMISVYGLNNVDDAKTVVKYYEDMKKEYLDQINANLKNKERAYIEYEYFDFRGFEFDKNVEDFDSEEAYYEAYEAAYKKAKEEALDEFVAEFNKDEVEGFEEGVAAYAEMLQAQKDLYNSMKVIRANKVVVIGTQAGVDAAYTTAA